ncbi:altronate dehydratase [Aequoribacter fuscus]|uniref:UxaA family hydrolase n=1 Tax=Aequoribacter fuscus TaxID=2518989 RepID=UPI00136373A1|nr:altronate dehydratase family protein [Aequoribacter fuscus]QHJ87474.1 altronate dehydratase [Aequoribacter fuscus]
MLTLTLSNEDNVAVARTALAKDVLLPEHRGLACRSDVPQFHKVAIKSIAKGQPVIKYRQVIGVALTDIAAGEHVHDHNCGMTDERIAPATKAKTAELPPDIETSFEGYLRADGEVGTRNYVGIITTVNCSASVAKAIEQYYSQAEVAGRYPNVDGVIAITHGSGCGMNKGEGYELLMRVCAGMSQHPNFGGVMLIGLGCEVLQLSALLDALPDDVRKRSNTLVIQEQGGTRATIEAGIEKMAVLCEVSNTLSRTPQPVSKLRVGLQCGGSDALSGITANPALGRAMDILTSLGGTAILSETPELYGAEQMLLARAASDEVADKLNDRLAWWREYAGKNGAQLDNNPSPGNKAGGLTTILEKSLGAQAKGGTSTMTDVVAYAQLIRKSGLVIMDSPGYDPVSVTGQMASGANLICFTTGRGSVYGSRPAPSIKLATNTPMYEKMTLDMDYNCGEIFDGEISLEDAAVEIYRTIVRVASGEKTKSELHGIGALEFLPWPVGAVL